MTKGFTGLGMGRKHPTKNVDILFTLLTFDKSTGNVVFLEEEESIQKEVYDLQRQGIDKIIALGHSGIVVDERIAKTVEGIDLIVGGDEQFFFYRGKSPTFQTRLTSMVAS